MPDQTHHTSHSAGQPHLYPEVSPDNRALYLGEALNDPDKEVRSAASRALQGMEAAAAPALGNVTRALNDPDSAIRAAAASIIKHIAPQEERVVNALVLCLEDSSDSVQADALFALEAIGPFARSAIPHIEAWLRRFKEAAGSNQALSHMGETWANRALRRLAGRQSTKVADSTLPDYLKRRLCRYYGHDPTGARLEDIADESVHQFVFRAHLGGKAIAHLGLAFVASGTKSIDEVETWIRAGLNGGCHEDRSKCQIGLEAFLARVRRG